MHSQKRDQKSKKKKKRNKRHDRSVCVVQSVHQLLPPPYRAVWLEWLDAEKAVKQQAKEKENKVFIMYTVQIGHAWSNEW